MLLKEYKRLVKGKEKEISQTANHLFKRDYSIDAVYALNRALSENGLGHPSFLCKNNNTANAVLFYCDAKATNEYNRFCKAIDSDFAKRYEDILEEYRKDAGLDY